VEDTGLCAPIGRRPQGEYPDLATLGGKEAAAANHASDMSKKGEKKENLSYLSRQGGRGKPS